MRVEQLTQNIQHKIFTHYDSGQSLDGCVCTCGWKGWPDTQEIRDRHLREAGVVSGGNLVKQMIYLASPHSHTSSAIREHRYKAALKCQNWLVSHGFWVFSPIVSSHHTTETLKMLDFDYWREFDADMIRRMDELWILLIPGTKESKGVNAEIEIAKLQGKKIYTIHEVIYPHREDGNYDYSVLPFIEWKEESHCS